MKKLIIVFILLFSTDLFAVELLVKRQANYTHSNPDKDRAGVYKRGDVIVAMPDGHGWGIEEHPLTTTYSPPRSFIVKIPGITVAQANKYLRPEVDDVDPSKIKTRRLWKIEADLVPQWVKTSIATTGEVTVTWNQIKTFIKNKKTGDTE